MSGDYAASVSDIHSVTSRLSQVSVSLIEFNKNENYYCEGNVLRQ